MVAMRLPVITCFLFLLFSDLFPQPGGEHTYDFLNLSGAARVASLGGKMTVIKDNDLNLTFGNPSLLDGSMENQLALNFVNYFSGIGFGYAGFALPSRPWGNLATGIQFINYGKFTGADETGVINGEFRASEYAIHLMWSHTWDSIFTFGLTFKPVFSSFERYTSFGIASDLGISYHRPGELFAASLVVRNLGSQITTYQGAREPLPLEILFGLSQKLQYAPFRFVFLLHHIETYRLLYDPPDETNNLYSAFSPAPERSVLEAFGENLMRHLIAGVEFTPLENFYLRAGYNYQRRKELQIAPRIGTVGFSWGFGLKISRFHISFGRATYHLAGSSNHFSVTTRPTDFFGKGM